MATCHRRRLCQLRRHLSFRGVGSASDGLPRVTWDEISKHNMREDIWVVIDGKVYDVTNLISESSGHPGGAEIPLEYAGKDASEFWNDIHGHLKDEILQVGRFDADISPAQDALAGKNLMKQLARPATPAAG